MKRLPVKFENKFCYDIVIDSGNAWIAQELEKFDLTSHRICIVTDSNVAAYHLQPICDALANTASQVITYTFPAGEDHKNLETVQKLYEFLIQNSFDRKDVLIALGGGVCGDLTGFTASTYLRGIRFFQAPTSLLAMVDSSIGGKTGVDFQAYKNMVGAFYMPTGVYMDISVLSTLQEREYLSGMGEIIKHGLIKDAVYFEWLIDHSKAIVAKDPEAVKAMILRSCEIKRDVVERDPKELGERALLNFGHSIGHAVEKLMDFSLLHGECVSIGMVAAAHISYQRGYLTCEELKRLESVLKSYYLPVSVHGLNVEDICHVMSKDKKMEAGQIKFILLHGIGNAVIDKTVTKEEIKRAIEYISTER